PAMPFDPAVLPIPMPAPETPAQPVAPSALPPAPSSLPAFDLPPSPAPIEPETAPTPSPAPPRSLLPEQAPGTRPQGKPGDGGLFGQ
ncbi:MAG: hypothetical protein AAB223_12260, partial [Pseudomonadota bacterium]